MVDAETLADRDEHDGQEPLPQQPLAGRLEQSTEQPDQRELVHRVVPHAEEGPEQAFPGAVRGLFPVVQQFWVGSCADARAGAVSVDLATQPVTAALPLAGVRVRVVNGAGVSLPGRSVTATHDTEAQGGCTAGEQWALPSTGATGSLGALPHGTWRLSTPGAPPVTVVLAPGQPVRDAPPLVTP